MISIVTKSISLINIYYKIVIGTWLDSAGLF